MDSSILRLLGSKDSARQWIHALHQYLALHDDLHAFSTAKWTRILSVLSPFLPRMEKCAPPMLQLSVLVCAARTWKLQIASTRFTWLAPCDDGGRSVRHFFGLLFGVEACQSISMTSGHTHPILEHASQTTTTTQVSTRAFPFFA